MKNKTLHKKILSAKESVILYELIPPQLDRSDAYIEAYCECTGQLLESSSVNVDAVNIPEVRLEHDHSEETSPDYEHDYTRKMAPVEFAELLKNQYNNQIEFMLNRCCVYDDLDKQKKWLVSVYKEKSFDSFIIVGGESSQIKYPGPTVTEMALFMREEYKKVLCGGIMIPTRRHQNVSHDEPNRLLFKSQNGIDFFTSQVICEPESTKKCLADYDALCKKNNVEPKRIFLSFAPIAFEKDILLLRWLGVDIPYSIESQLLKADIGVGWRSIQSAKNVLSDILEFCEVSNISVPLGINIEHIARHNFELSKEFIEQLGSIYLQRPKRSASE